MLPWIILHIPLAVLAAPAPPPCQLDILPPFVLEERTVDEFNGRVNAYVRLHRRLERALPSEHLVVDPDTMALDVDALHEAMVMARPNARVGTLFTQAVSDVIVGRLERALVANGYTTTEVLAAVDVGHVPGTPEPVVNGRFPPTHDVEVWPALLAVLPPLAYELEYRFVNRSLVIVDRHADLVVDILQHALPATAPPAS